MKTSNTHSKITCYTFTVLGVWWALATLLATIQAYNTYRSFIVLLGVLLAALLLYAHLLLGRKILEQNKVARIIAFVYAGAHFIPLLAQLLGLKEPGLDNLIPALIGCLVLSLVETSSCRYINVPTSTSTPRHPVSRAPKSA